VNNLNYTNNITDKIIVPLQPASIVFFYTFYCVHLTISLKFAIVRARIQKQLNYWTNIGNMLEKMVDWLIL
jgi:hypothetical protein